MIEHNPLIPLIMLVSITNFSSEGVTSQDRFYSSVRPLLYSSMLVPRFSLVTSEVSRLIITLFSRYHRCFRYHSNPVNRIQQKMSIFYPQGVPPSPSITLNKRKVIAGPYQKRQPQRPRSKFNYPSSYGTPDHKALATMKQLASIKLPL